MNKHQAILDKVLRYGRDLGRSDTVRRGTGTRCRVRKYARYTVRLDLFYASYVPLRAECLILCDGLPIARYVTTDDSINTLQALYYDGVLVNVEQTLK